MKFSNPTQRKEKLRCPKRYFYRYIYRPDSAEEQAEHSRRRQLYGLRELAGHLVHRTLAEMVEAIADGDFSWNAGKAGQACLDGFMEIVAKSLALEPGEWEGGLQLAETFNGLKGDAIAEEVKFWRDSIPTMIENGFRVALHLGIRQRAPDYSVEAEKRVVWQRNGGAVPLVLDVLTQSQYRVLCIDWKCHAIDNTDVAQVRSYLQYLHQGKGIPDSRLYGFAVDLRREEFVSIDYKRPGLHTSTLATSLAALGILSAPPKDPHPARPHPDLCTRCPYAAICPDNTIAALGT
jgi:hypothetical protein